jgi:hypothetical protein
MQAYAGPATKDTLIMITITRTASIAPGQTGEAVAFGHQVAKYFKDKYATPLEVLLPIGGNPARIAWHARYDTLAQWESLTAKLLADKEYMAMVAKHAGTFLPGSVRDSIWRTV